MKRPNNRILITAILAITPLIAANADSSRLSVVYENTPNTTHQPLIDRLKQDDALPALVTFINSTVPLAEPLTLRMGAEEGPLFDPSINEIWVPSEFLLEINERFVDAKLAKNAEERNNVMLDVFTHTLFHEIGHAIIAQFNIPTLGKEEDAADNLATVLILEFLEDGNAIALNAADMFALEDEDSDTFQSEDFWDEHSLDIQRYFATLCHIYGAQPDDNEDLVEAGELEGEHTGELSEDKADSCIGEYEQIKTDWLFVLDELREKQ